MADIRINALATTAASTASDDFIAVDGSANGTRKLNAYSPTFGGNLTVSGTGTFSGNLSATGEISCNGSGGALRADSRTGSGLNWYIYNPTGADLRLFNSTGGNVLILTNAGAATLTSNLTVSGTGTSTFAGNVSVGKATFSTWDTVKALEIGDTLGNSINSGGGTDIRVGANAYYQGGWKYAQTFPSTYYQQYNGVHSWHNAPLGTINTAITFSQPMTLTAAGNLLLGPTSASGSGKLELATHTTSAGGIGFGTDISLFRRDATALKLNSSFDISNGSTGASIVNAIQLNGGGSSGANNNLDAIQWGGGGLAWLRIYGIRDAGGGFGGTQYFQTMNGSGTLTTALTLDSSQNATFAGKVVTSSAIGATSADSSTTTIQAGASSGVNSKILVRDSWNGSNNNNAFFAVQLGDGSTTSDALRIDYQKNATFAGKVTVSGTADSIFGLGGTGNNTQTVLINGSSANTYGPAIHLRRNGTTTGFLASESATNTNNLNNLVLWGGLGNDVKIFTNNGTLAATYSGANATFAGSIAIGNTVNTVSPTSPNRTITMVIGGTTYYIHAKTTND